MNSFNIILTSSLFASIVSALVSFFISTQLRKIDFRNDYYKELLKKRLDAYQNIEMLIADLKGVVLDDFDRKPYHMIFGYGENEFIKIQNNLMIAISKSLWIDKKSMLELESLNNIFYSINNKIHQQSEDRIIEIGKDYYQKLSDARFSLEQSTKQGLYNLHDVHKAFIPEKINRKRYIWEV